MEAGHEALLFEWGSVSERLVRVDRRSGVIHGVKLLGLRSRNKRIYPAETLRQACKLYERAKVNVGHGASQPGTFRDYRDRIGLIRQVRYVDGEGLFADLVYNPKHALAEQLAWDAEHLPENVGLSHSVLARTHRQGEETIVEAILHVFSVDLVADPATTDGLFEAKTSAESAADSHMPAHAQASAILPVEIPGAWMRAMLETLTAQDVEKICPPLAEALRAPQHEAIGQLREEVTLLRHKLEHAERTLAIWRALAEFGLPLPGTPSFDAELVDESFLESLYQATDPQAVRRLVGKRAELYATTKGLGTARIPSCRPASPPPRWGDDVKHFVQAICR